MKDNVVITPTIAFVLIAVVFALLLFVGGAAILVFGTSASVIISATIVSELLIMAIPLGYMLMKKVNVASYIGLEKKTKNVLLGIAFGGGLLLFDILITSTLVSIFGPSQAVEDSNKTIANLSGSASGLLLASANLALAGVCEEFTFRAFLQNTIDRRHSFVPAVVISSLAWALFHFDPQLIYMASIFLAGIVLGYVYHRSHSYILSAVAHSTLNLIVLALLLFVG